ncbi:MAG: excinuclease ABC subunit UvrC [Candidatus Polarisedimenticolaceae bacterium]|nr:excinuclease ABC subunit UvrC [Candidatus Polarisedimenticolaceae bacterium]
MSEQSTEKPFDAEAFLNTLTGCPGVYRMIGAEEKILYVGKAKNLKKRVSSYFKRGLNRRLQLMVSQIVTIEIIVTHTEAEALILENNLIKSLKPRYNILLRDDKGYPYIYLSTEQTFPRISSFRGRKREKGRYFGPYPSASSMRETLHILQKLFPVRQCDESFYRNRSRACLQYQIKRCTAPCVDLISPEEYAKDVDNVILFLEGKGNQVVDALVARMEQAASELAFEQAARYRDQISSLQKVQERQYVSGERGDLDLIAVALTAGTACVQLFFIRNGRNLGNKVFFPKIPAGASSENILSAFIAQHYLGKAVPSEIIVSHMPSDQSVLQDALSSQTSHRVAIRGQVRSERARWLEMAKNNADLSLKARLASNADHQRRIEALRDLLELDEIPSRIECFDISHTGGEQTVASCVVFNELGALVSDYRRFNIEGITPGDDYAALHQALTRRYMRIQKGEGRVPDILFIDGGKGQINTVHEALQEVGIVPLLVGIAKGPDRVPGKEQLFLYGQDAPIMVPPNSPALLLIQQIRDEAHRFAITGHRKRRAKSRRESGLEQIAGIGPKRRQRLLKQFGGLQALSEAGVEDIARVDGISRTLAQLIYHTFHEQE